MTVQELCRTWSADALFSPGAQSDELLTFNSDGTGLIEVLNWGLGSVITFRWEQEEVCQLSIYGCKDYEIIEAEAPGRSLRLVGDSEFIYRTTEASVIREQLPVLGDALVLRLPGFADAVLQGIGQDAYGYDPAICARQYNFPTDEADCPQAAA